MQFLVIITDHTVPGSTGAGRATETDRAGEAGVQQIRTGS